MKGMILVTGANGFVGSALVARLARDGRDVLAGVRSTSTVPSPGMRVVSLGDLAEPGNRESLLAGVSCVVHAAARVDYKFSSVVTAIVLSDAFRMQALPHAETNEVTARATTE